MRCSEKLAESRVTVETSWHFASARPSIALPQPAAKGHPRLSGIGTGRIGRRPRRGSFLRLLNGLGDGLDVANIRPATPAKDVDTGELLAEFGALATELLRIPIIQIRSVIEFGMAHA